MDKSAECREDPDCLLTVENVRDFEEERGPLPEGAWLLFRSGWGARIRDEAAHTQAPDFDVEFACRLAEEYPLVGVETLSIDAGTASSSSPTLPHCRPAGHFSSRLL